MPTFIFIFLLFLSGSCSANNKILVVESYHPSYSWSSSYRRGIKEAVDNKYDLIYYSLDSKRLAKKDYMENAEKAWEVYKKIKPSVVIVADDDALRLLSNRLQMTDTPVVYLGINADPRRYNIVNAKNFSGVLERPLLKRSVLLIKKILPIKKVLLLMDKSTTSRLISQDTFGSEKSLLLGDIKLDIKHIKTVSDWKRTVLSAKNDEYDALIVGLYHTLVDQHGTHIDSEHILEWTSENTPVPPFGFWKFSVGHNKNVGGYVLSGYDEGLLAGRLALNSVKLQDDNIRIMPQRGGSGRFVFSDIQLKKWNIELPSSVLNRAVILD